MVALATVALLAVAVLCGCSPSPNFKSAGDCSSLVGTHECLL